MSQKPDDKQDVAWIEVQKKKAFTHWVNSYVEKRNKKIDKIEENFSDGLTLLDFVELLVDGKIQQKYQKQPKNRINKIENNHIALSFLKQNGVEDKMLTISAEDLADQNLKLILGFLWMLFRKFRILTLKGAEGSNSAEETLLAWVRQVTEGYKNVKVESFSSSFNDGTTFLALVHRMKGDLFSYDQTIDNNPPLKVAETAIEFAEKQLGIPKLIEAKDLVAGKVDTRAIVLYTSLFLHAYRELEEKNKLQGAHLQTSAKAGELQTTLDKALTEKEEVNKKLSNLQQQYDALKEKWQESEERSKKLGIDRELAEQEAIELRGRVKKFEEQLADREVNDKKGLDILVKNIPEHVVDVASWQDFLELEAPKNIPQKKNPPDNWNERIDFLVNTVSDENKTLPQLLKKLEVKMVEEQQQQPKKTKKR